MVRQGKASKMMIPNFHDSKCTNTSILMDMVVIYQTQSIRNIAMTTGARYNSIRSATTLS